MGSELVVGNDELSPRSNDCRLVLGVGITGGIGCGRFLLDNGGLPIPR